MTALAGKGPFSPRERCRPGGAPDSDIYTRVAPIYSLPTPKEVTIVIELGHQVRHVTLNVPHLIVDAIGLNDRTLLDDYNTPHSDTLHVIERFKMLEDGKTRQLSLTLDDPDAFNMHGRR